jgi:hypothetical protein
MSTATENPQAEPPASRVARLLAIQLAIGGSFWGLLLLPVLLSPNVPALAVAVLVPGYLVTVGYIVRSVCTPPPEGRLLIWVSSLLVQGAWLLFLIGSVIEKAVAGGSVAQDVSSVPAVWWLFATVASVVGLLADRPKQAERGAADGSILDSPPGTAETHPEAV